MGDVALNLRTLCNTQVSISDVCRRIGINRQQFNKYLSGRHQPTLRTAARIAKHFGLEGSALFLPHEHLRGAMEARHLRGETADKIETYLHGMEEELRASFEALAAYCGNYFLHYRSPAWPRGLIKSFISIRQSSGATFSKSIERLYWRGRRQDGFSVQKCRSIVHFEGDRIYVIDRNHCRRSDLSMLILLPSNRSHLRHVYGLLTSVTGSGGRLPYASRVLLERLDDRMRVREALGQCAVYEADDTSIPAYVWEATRNSIDETDGTLNGLPL